MTIKIMLWKFIIKVESCVKNFVIACMNAWNTLIKLFSLAA